MLAVHQANAGDGQVLSPSQEATLLRVLVIDDCESDAEHMLRTLWRDGWRVAPKRIDGADEMSAAIHESSWDLVLVDYRIPGFGAFEALSIYMEHGIDRMPDLINGLLSYSRVIHDSEAACSEIAAGDVLADVLSNLAKSIDESGALITYDVLPTVRANAVQLGQVFQKLLSNAIKYRRSEAPPRVRVTCEIRDAGAVFSVADNGIGINADHWDRVFVIFKRLHNQQEYPGLGRGLSVAKRIVERYGGRMWLDSEVGVGSIFHFSLPAAQPITAQQDGWVI